MIMIMIVKCADGMQCRAGFLLGHTGEAQSCRTAWARHGNSLKSKRILMAFVEAAWNEGLLEFGFVNKAISGWAFASP